MNGEMTEKQLLFEVCADVKNLKERVAQHSAEGKQDARHLHRRLDEMVLAQATDKAEVLAELKAVQLKSIEDDNKTLLKLYGLSGAISALVSFVAHWFRQWGHH